MNEEIRKVLPLVVLGVLLAVLVAGAAFLGVQTGFERLAQTQSNDLGIQAMAPIRFTNAGARMTFLSGSTLDLQTGTTVTWNSATPSGPVRYGVTTSYTSTNNITHGFSAAPTVCVVTPSNAITATINAITTTTFSVTASANGGTIYWMCGK